jgi:hypothetical protein
MQKAREEGFKWVPGTVGGTGYDPVEYRAFTVELYDALNKKE